MIVSNCPICGRQPTIREWGSVKKYKNGIRRRGCGCPNYCSVIPCTDWLNHSWFEFDGEGDANAIYKLWNKAVERYKKNKELNWWEQDFSKGEWNEND